MTRAATTSPGAGGAGTALPRLQRRIASRYPNWLDYVGYGLFHLAALGVFWTEPGAAELAAFGVGYLVAMTGATLCFHRYFAHGAFATSRGFQLVLAVWGTLSLEKGPLWWASVHRHHHRYADTPDDIHSPRHQGALYAYMGWFLDRRIRDADLSQCPRLAACPELVWLTRYNFVPPIVYAATLWLLLGWDGLVWGFVLSTLAVWHATHMISSLLHGPVGYRNFPTFDNSRNCLPMALLLLGEGYHNNHHYAPYSARCGLRWWELDVNWWLVRLLRRCGLVWDVRTLDAAAATTANATARTLDRRFDRWVGGLRRALRAGLDAGSAPSLPDDFTRRRIAHAVDARVDAFVQAARPHLSSAPATVAGLLDRLPENLAAAAAQACDRAAGDGHPETARVQAAARRQIAESNIRYLFLESSGTGPPSARSGT